MRSYFETVLGNHETIMLIFFSKLLWGYEMLNVDRKCHMLLTRVWHPKTIMGTKLFVGKRNFASMRNIEC